MWPKQLQLSLRGTWPTLLHNRKRKGCCAAFGFWKSVRALPGQDYKGKMCIAMRESLTEASRHQVQGRVIKWQHFCHLEKSPQSWQKKKRLCDRRYSAQGCPSLMHQCQQPSDYTAWDSGHDQALPKLGPWKRKYPRGQPLLFQAPTFCY